MIEAIETWIFEQLSADTTLLEQFDADAAGKRLIRSGEGSEGDPYPAISFVFSEEIERQTGRCGELVRCVLAWDVTVKVESKSFADSQPYATQIGAILAPKAGVSGDLRWTSTQGAIVGRRERGAGRQHYVVHGNTYLFEVRDAG